jgi:small-conductance mechanosensitive channel
MNLASGPLRDFILSLADEATPVQWAVQAALALASLAIGWIAAKTVCERFKPSDKWQFGVGGFQRVVFPAFALAFVWTARFFLDRWGQPFALLSIAVSLLFAFLAIRVAVYILGHVIPRGAALNAVVRVIAWIAWIVVALHVTGLLPEVRLALDDVGFTMGKSDTRISLLIVIQALGAMAITLTVAMWLARVTAGRVLAAKTVEMSTRVVVAKIINTFALVVGVLIALPIAGVDITVLSVFGGALAVGLGFGLQKVAASYVSGFIVLLERSLRIGDVITVENRKGVVEAIESRYTVLKAGDGTETIIPNESLISKDVVHHTYTDPKVASVITLTVAYDTDADRACEILAEIGRRSGRALKEPSPLARVTALAENGIQMELVVWIDDPEKGESDLRSELIKDVLRTFKAEGIVLSAPRREVRLIATPEMKETPDLSKS